MVTYTCSDVLDRLCNASGNTWLSYGQVQSFAKRQPNILQELEHLVADGSVKTAQKENQKYVTLRKYYQAEIDITNHIYRLVNQPCRKYPDAVLDKIIDQIEADKGAKLHVNQRDAVKKGVNSSFMILTGGPGTGKTFVLNFINETLMRLNPKIRIDYTAPTGKAARRITESTGFYAQTLHSKLRITADNMNPTALSSMIFMLTVDEVSMLDIWVMDALMKAIPNGMRIILVGDTDQLPSVGPGAILRDMIASKVVPVAALTATFRQAGDSTIFDNIMRIKNGNPNLISGDDFQIAVRNGLSPQEILLWMYKKELKEWGSVSDVMCLTPFRQNGETCSNVMNQKLQAYVNPSGVTYQRSDGMCFRKGDQVMQLQNREQVANGDIGIVTDVYPGVGVTVKYYDCERDYGVNYISDITLAYAMSVHKSQGSEAKSVITVLLDEHAPMLQRNLLYTAVTRAKKNCMLLCDPLAVDTAVKTEASSQRITMLKELLQYKFTGKYN